MKRILCILMAAAMAINLAGCRRASEAQDGNGYDAGYSTGLADGQAAGYEKGYEAGLAEGKKQAASQETPGITEGGVTSAIGQELPVLYDSDLVCVELEGVPEDSSFYHVRLELKNKTNRDLIAEIPALAINGLTLENTNSCDLPAGGNALLTMSCNKDTIKSAGLHTEPEEIKIALALYSEDYDRIETGSAEIMLKDGGAAVEIPVKEELYNGNGIRISSMGISEEIYGDRPLKILLENNTDSMITLDGGIAAAPGENLEATGYGYCLPGTKAVMNISFYTENFMSSVDPEGIPFVNIAFCIGLENGTKPFMTEPVKVNLGTEQRFELSADRKTLTIKQTCASMEDTVWTVTVGDEEVMVSEKLSVDAETPEEGMEQMTAVYTAGKPGTSSLLVQYHPTGISLEATEDYWPTIYFQRRLHFLVTEEGTFELDDVFLDVPNYTDGETNDFWYYILRNDGTVKSKDTSAG